MFPSDPSSAVRHVRRSLHAIVDALDPEQVGLGEVSGLWEAFDSVERLAAAGKLLLADRVEQSQQWRRQGFSSAADYMAARSGSSANTAKSTLDASKKLKKLPATQKAVRRGELSREKANAVADAAAANPSAEERLLQKAQRSSLHDTRQECGRAKAAADADPDATRKRIHSCRRLRTYTDGEGAWNLSMRGTVDDGALVESALQPLIEQVFAAARAKGVHEEREAYAFDALVELAKRSADGEGVGRRKSRHRALIRVDLDALVRGTVADGELCEITGVGPIPVSRARELLGESVLYLVITRGADVANVTYLGRGANAAQRIALLWSMPRCTVEGCNRTLVQNDHRIPYELTKHTRLDELDPLCRFDHFLKTVHGWELVDGKGRRAFVPPGDPRHPNHARGRGRSTRAPNGETAA